MSRIEQPQADPMGHLVVHSAPDATLAQRTRFGRVKMLLVWAVCAAPVVASYFTYYVIRPQGRTNYGELIMPPKPLPSASAMPLTSLDGQVVLPTALKGQWLLVTVAKAACDATCEQHLYLQRQLRETLGKDKDKVDRVWLVTDAEPIREALRPGLQNAWVLRVAPNTLAAWLSPQSGHALEAHTYLVDPRGDWMMRFPVQGDASRMKKDLSRLIKANESWDEPGR
jgi:hypothetical protein